MRKKILVPIAFSVYSQGIINYAASIAGPLGAEMMIVNVINERDLEAVEPRSKRFVEDFFTARERAWVERTPYPLHDRHVALTWSAKESALKLLRVGLRRDTRRVEVDIEDPESAEEGWHRLSVTVAPESRSLTGRWRQDEEVVLTVVSEDPGAQLGASRVADTLNI